MKTFTADVSRIRLALLALILALAGMIPPASAQTETRRAGPRMFAYVGPDHIITAEVASKHSFVLNFINLVDFVIVVQPNEFIYKGESGRFYIGQVFEMEHKDTRGETWKYTATMLLKGQSATGLTVVGDFQELDAIAELSIRIGAKRFFLDVLDRIDFEQLAAKVGEIDLTAPNPRASVKEANIAPMGRVSTTDGTSEWDRDWEGLIRPDGINVPKVIEHPKIEPTPQAKKEKRFGRVRVSALINKNGGAQDLKIEKGLGRDMDERVLEAVRNSWRFLPAARNGEVIEATITFTVDFRSGD